MNRKTTRTCGFTLAEMLVALAIASLTLIAAASFLGAAGGNYSRIGGGLSAERDARAVITQIGMELATATSACAILLENSQTAWPADHFGFTSLQPAHAQSKEGHIGDLCAVHYYLADLNISGKTVRCLMRGFRESRETFTALKNDGTASLFSKQPDIDEPVAMRVVSLEANPMYRKPDGTWHEWSHAAPYPPDAVEIRLIIARPEFAARLHNSNDWDEIGTASHVMREARIAHLKKELDVYETMISYGSHDCH